MKNIYKSYQDYLSEIFPYKVRKIPVNSGFTCPTRDGAKSFGGCTYCNNESFSPWYTKQNESILSQIEKGINFFSDKYGKGKYLVYFQSYTNTYSSIKEMNKIFTQAANSNDVVGLIIGTRPDCINEEILDYLKKLSEKLFIAVEFGIETIHEKTLKFVNRGHTYRDSEKAVLSADKKGIHTGAHLILNLPGETKKMMLETAVQISQLPLKTLKIHQLQIIKNTIMAGQYAKNPELFNFFLPEEYSEFVAEFLEYLNPETAIERFISEAPPAFRIAPDWKGIRHNDIIKMITAVMKTQNMRQGRLFNG